MKLYHYTCAHSLKGIRRDGALKPNRHPLLRGIPLVWLTDLEDPIREPLGLTSRFITCDRTQFRATVDAEAERWVTFAARELRPAERRALEEADGALPMHWWVSEIAVPVLALGPVRS